MEKKINGIEGLDVNVWIRDLAISMWPATWMLSTKSIKATIRL